MNLELEKRKLEKRARVAQLQKKVDACEASLAEHKTALADAIEELEALEGE